MSGRVLLLRSLVVELELDQLSGFLRSGFELPMPDCCHRTLGQKWMPADHGHGLHRAIGGDQRLNLYRAMNVHGVSQRWIHGRGLNENLPTGVGGLLSPGNNWEHNNGSAKEKPDSTLPHQGLHSETEFMSTVV